MKIYSEQLENGSVEALLLIEPQEATRWDDASAAVNAAIAAYAGQKGLGMLLFFLVPADDFASAHIERPFKGISFGADNSIILIGCVIVLQKK